MGLQWLRVNFDVVLNCLTKRPQSLERVLGICGSVSRRWTRVWETVRVRIKVGLRTSNVDSRRHGGGWKHKAEVVNVSSHDVAMLMSASYYTATQNMKIGNRNIKIHVLCTRKSLPQASGSKLEWIHSSFQMADLKLIRPKYAEAFAHTILVAVSRLWWTWRSSNNCVHR